MKNYDAYSPGIFITDEKEISKLIPYTDDPRTVEEKEKEKAIEHLRATYGGVKEYKVFIIPKHLKRSTHDSSKLLVMFRESGIIAKRHNNSQWLRV